MSTEKLVEQAARRKGIVYIRTTRGATPVIYGMEEEFEIGGNKVLRRSEGDRVAVVAAGVTLFEALAASDELGKEKIPLRVIDLYSIKPIDAPMLKEALGPVRAVLTVEDHHPEGGLGEAVRTALSGHDVTIYSLAVTKIPRSGKPGELLDYEEISTRTIIKTVRGCYETGASQDPDIPRRGKP